MTVKITKPEVNIREKISELDKPSGIAGEAMLRAKTPQEQNELIGANLNNIIINGDFQVWQRGTSFTTGNKYTADRWYLYGNGSTNETVTQQTDVPENSGNSYSLRITAGGAYAGSNYAMLRYKAEPKDLMKLNNAVGSTLQFWIKSDNPGLYTITFLQHRISGSQRQISRTYTINSSDVWEFKTVTIPADSTVLYDANTNYLSIDWAYGKNSQYFSGTFNDHSWVDNVTSNRQPAGQTNAMSASGKKFSISGVQFVPGKYPSGLPHLHRSYGEVLALCQRYYYKTDIIRYKNLGRFNHTTGSGLAWWNHPVYMRAAPTMSTSGTWNTNTGYTGALSYAGISKDGCQLASTVNISANQMVYAHGASIIGDAEL